jgi:predicted ABC-type ATPase
MLNSKRLRIFAGPNGSGKSTLFPSIQEQFGTGPFINSDIVEEDISRNGFINLEDYELTTDQQTWDEFCLLQESTTLNN